MARLAIVQYPDPILRKVSEEVITFDDKLKKLAEDMLETMYAAPGIGLAAPQVGVAKRVTVVDISEERTKPLVLINPVIVDSSEPTTSTEGCLSIPDYRDTIPRMLKVRVSAKDLKGNSFEVEAEDLFAFCLQHEIDHINGILFIDHLSRLKRELFRKKFSKRESD